MKPEGPTAKHDHPSFGLVLLLLLVLCTVPLSNLTATLDDPVEVQTTEGRQLQDVNCSGMTFEDLSYDRASSRFDRRRGPGGHHGDGVRLR